MIEFARALGDRLAPGVSPLRGLGHRSAVDERKRPGPDDEAEAAFQSWRGKATGAMIALFGLAVLPLLIAWMVGYQLPPGPSWIAMTTVMLTLAALGLGVRRWSPGVRLWLLMVIAYLASVQGLIWYSGAMARVWLAGLPVLALILGGRRSASIAALLSVGLMLIHALAVVTGSGEDWRLPQFDENQPAVVLARLFMWLAFFVPFLIVVYRAHLFHLHSLASERATSARMKEEVWERRAALESLARASAERERLVLEIGRVGDEERRRLGQELHDGVSQQFALMLLRATALEKRLAAEYPGGRADARDLVALLESTMDDVREVARSLSPVAMDPEALGPALSVMARRAGQRYKVPCDYRETGDTRLRGREATLDLYRIAQEAVNNAAQHAHARRIAVTLAGVDGRVLLSVKDDGTGLPPSARSSGLGLRIMEYRAQRIGGTLVVERPPEGGTRIVCQVPRGLQQ